MSRISDEYLRWSMGQEKVSFRRDEAGRITKVIKRVDAALLPVYRALSKLQTPYLSPILSISEPDAGIIQVEESYIEGESLQEFLEAHGTLDEAEIQHCFLDIAQALKLLHSLQPPIIHRDIKPANIIKSKDGRYVLVDFDAAREYARKQDSDTHIILTPGYASPEQYGFGQSDRRSDIFMLGATMFEMRTGRQFRPGVSPSGGALGRIIARCTAMSPKDRYQSAGALISALNRLQTRKRRNILLAAAAFLALLCAGGVWYYRRAVAITCTCMLDVSNIAAKLDGIDFHEGDPHVELELAITPRCTCVADINRVRMYPQYLVLEGDAPATVQLYLDYSRAFIRESCPAKEHAPAPVPAEYLECLIGRNAEEEGIASISKNGVLTAYKPGSFNVSIRASYNGSGEGKGCSFFVLSEDMAKEGIPLIEQSNREGCTCQLDVDKISLSCLETTDPDNHRQIQITLDASQAYLRQGCTAAEHSVLGGRLITYFTVLAGGSYIDCSEYGLLTGPDAGMYRIMLLTSFNGAYYEIERDLEL